MGASWEALGSLLGASWGLLGGSWEALGSLLGASWEHFGGNVVRYGAFGRYVGGIFELGKRI